MISVITPSNSDYWIFKAYKSLLHQTVKDWEWIIVANGALYLDPDFRDPRVKFHRHETTGNVGELKKKACDLATGDIVVEFDHDDELDENCLKEILAAFERAPGAVFAYSDAISVNTATNQPYFYGEGYGWSYTQANFYGPFTSATAHGFLYPIRPPELPQNIARIWFAPDHVRAWKASAYRDVGGHNPNLHVCDDLDLICRLYLKGEFIYINKQLYRYNIHGQNTWLKNSLDIEKIMWSVYDNYIEDISLKYWTEQGYYCVDLGGGIGKPPGWMSVDSSGLGDVTADLNERWPFKDNSVGVFRARDIIEHLKNPIHVMNEIHRCLVHGGLILIEVPSTDGRGAFQDPSHVSFWNSNSVWYYTKEAQQKYIKHLGVNCRFQVVRLENYFPSEWHRLHNIIYTKAHLAAVKTGPRLHGLYEI